MAGPDREESHAADHEEPHAAGHEESHAAGHEEPHAAGYYDALRAFVPTARREAPEPEQDPRVSVMEWLLGLGHTVARRFRSASAISAANRER